MPAGGGAGGRKASGGSVLNRLKAERTSLSIKALQQPQNKEVIYAQLSKVADSIKAAERAERKARKGL